MEYLKLKCKVGEVTKITLSYEIAKIFNIEPKEELKLLVEERKIIITKELDKCTFCDSIGNMINFKNKYVCVECLERLKKAKLEAAYY